MTNHWDEKPVDFKFLMDSGLLFEINRSILHLFGLALTLKKNESGEVELGPIKDCRKNPETLLFDDNTWELGKLKLDKFMSEFGNKQLEIRENALGWGCQWTKQYKKGKKNE